MKTDLEAAMSLMPERTDRDLVRLAIDPSLRGFSRLEFLGDAILGLAVYSAGTAAGRNRNDLLRAVSNSELRRIKDNRLAAVTSAPTGDVIETLVAAIHLSAGFDAADRWAVSLCLPDCKAAVGGDERSRLARQRMDSADLAFVGAALIDAVLADHLVRTEPDQTQGWYSSQKNELRSRRRLTAIAAGLTPDGSARARTVARLSDRLEAELAELFYEQGWSCASDVRAALALDD